MAKKTKSKARKPSEVDTTPQADVATADSVPLEESSDPPQTTDSASTEATNEVESNGNGSAESTNDDVKKLRAENASLKEENATLKDRLHALETEFLQLKGKGQVDGTAAASEGGQTEYMVALQERLTKLKKEQAEADAARDSAWTELKRCVQEIARLANPNYVPESPKA